MTLTEFLLARIAEDELMARVVTEAGGIKTPFNLIPPGPFDPARVLVECEAKWRIVEVCSPAEIDGVPESGGGVPDVLRHLAAVYAGHPDYNEEWKP